VAIFGSLLDWGRAALPMHVAAGRSVLSDNAPHSEADHRGTMLFIWMMLCLVGVGSFVSASVGLLLRWNNHLLQLYVLSVWPDQLVQALSLFLIVFLALKVAGASLSSIPFGWPPPRYIAFALLISLAGTNIWPFLVYLSDRVQWAIHRSPDAIPFIESYFALPALSAIAMFAHAFVEEMAWRGFLQPRLISRYGLFRGIFFVGLVWGAFHFGWDFNSGMNASDVIWQIVVRLSGTVAMSYAFAWLTIWSESIWPAAIAHATFNAFVTTAQPVHTPRFVSILIWAVIAFLLFRWFPPPVSSPILEVRSGAEQAPVVASSE
jgi:membrane protease YdiL (CAAX protease family)